MSTPVPLPSVKITISKSTSAILFNCSHQKVTGRVVSKANGVWPSGNNYVVRVGR